MICERTTVVEINEQEQIENRNINLYLIRQKKDCNSDEIKIYTYFFMKLLTNILTNLTYYTIKEKKETTINSQKDE